MAPGGLPLWELPLAERTASPKAVQLLGAAWSTQWCKGLAPSLIHGNFQSLPGPRALRGTGCITTSFSVHPVPRPSPGTGVDSKGPSQ